MRRWLLTETGALRAAPALLINALAIGLLVFLGIAYVAQQQRNICGLIVLIDDRNQKLPPVEDEDTMRFRAELHHYRITIGCKENGHG